VSVGDQVRVDLTREALLEARQAGELLGVKASAIAASAREGRLPCLPLGPCVIRFTTPMLEQFCDERLDGQILDVPIFFVGRPVTLDS
jgi:hypothetical protein